MCEDCEQGESMMVVYSRKVERRGWRPPAKAASAPRHSDAAVTGGDDAGPQFSCERPRRGERRREIS